MRYQEIKEQVVDEAPMNPSAFAKSVEAGHDAGVQVGFEFEVCIPKESVNRWKNADAEEEVAPNRYNPNSIEWVEGKAAADMMAGFARYGRRTVKDNIEDLFKNKASVARELGYNSVWETYTNWANEKVKEFQRTHKSTVIKKMKELFKNPAMSEKFTDHSGRANDNTDDERTLKDVAIEELREKTGLDFSGKISAAELKQALPGIVEAMTRMYYRTHNPIDRAFMEVAEADSDAVNSYRVQLFPPGRFNVDPEQLIRNSENFTKFCNDTYGTDNLKELLKTKWAFKGRVNNNTETLKEKLWYFVTPDAEPPESLQPRYRSSYNDEYKDGAEFLKANLKDSFGDNMVIFDRYHQDSKKLDRWYIEPDGSLHPNDGDYSAEVVSPPLKARDAMYALNKFYSDAAGMKLYTNNSTGFHINVSIPEELDVLKLAMFVGDQHVLRSFGRENNRYANSILKSLQRDVSSNSESYQTLGDPESQAQQLKTIAERLSGDHFATVNFNGNYVSFRHAGGDYLSQYEQIKNTVGRFIHAMIIASDPQMYRNEYMKKLTVMVGKAAKPEEKFDVKANGIPALIADFILFKDEQGEIENARNSVAAWLANNIDAEHYITSSNGSANRLLTANGLATKTRERITSGGDAECVRAVIYPTNIRQLGTINTVARNTNLTDGVTGNPFGVYDGGTRYTSSRPKVAVGAMTLTKLTQKDKGFVQAYRGLSGGENKRLPLPEGDE